MDRSASGFGFLGAFEDSIKYRPHWLQWVTRQRLKHPLSVESHGPSISSGNFEKLLLLLWRLLRSQHATWTGGDPHEA